MPTVGSDGSPAVVEGSVIVGCGAPVVCVTTATFANGSFAGFAAVVFGDGGATDHVLVTTGTFTRWVAGTLFCVACFAACNAAAGTA